MRLALLLTFFALLTVPATAEERAAFFGTWGTPQQCAGTPLKPGGTVLATPYRIGPEWLKHGRVWCRLSWFPIQPRKDGAFTGARAQCGEDSVRGYTLRLDLKQDTLILRWDVFRATEPMQRC